MNATLFLTVLFFQTTPVQSQTFSDLAPVRPPVTDPVSKRSPPNTRMIFVPEGTLEIEDTSSAPRIVGFEMYNEGPNRIIPFKAPEIGSGPSRTFHFHFREHARQDLYLSITDAPDAFLSHLMESYLYLFPRKNLPAFSYVETPENQRVLQATLPTGEVVQFDPETKEIRAGVLQETGPIDLSPNRFARDFARIEYHGTGVMVRVNRRGGDPRLKTMAQITQGKKRCTLPSSLLFNQDETSNVEFLFPSDQEFDSFLQKKCQMSFL